jgi:hypothetical protein
MKNQKEMATKAVHATLGAPVVITRQVRHIGGQQLRELRERFAGYSEKRTATAQDLVDEYAVEGEKVATQIRGNTVVEELQHRVDLDKVTDRVEKLRDQLEAAMQTWRESFNPGEAKEAAKKVAVEAEEPKTVPAAKRPAKATGTTARKPAARKPAARKPAAKAAVNSSGTKATTVTE